MGMFDVIERGKERVRKAAMVALQEHFRNFSIKFPQYSLTECLFVFLPPFIPHTIRSFVYTVWSASAVRMQDGDCLQAHVCLQCDSQSPKCAIQCGELLDKSASFP